MLEVLFQMAGLIVCGVVWRLVKPAGLEPVMTRKVLTSLVYYLLLPALVLSVLWRAELGGSSFLLALSAALGVVVGAALSTGACRVLKVPRNQAGAIILATAFPNATYLGLPVLEATFGSWARSVAIQYDLFACTPLFFTLGVLIATRHGEAQDPGDAGWRGLLRIPAVWAAVAAVFLNLGSVPLPSVLGGLLGLLERGVVPLMLFSLGLSLQWRREGWRLSHLLPLAVFRLMVIPAIVLPLTTLFGFSGDMRAAIVLEAAMPSMVIGIVLCDKFNLDVSLYATAVTVTTGLSIVTLPLWYGWLV